VISGPVLTLWLYRNRKKMQGKPIEEALTSEQNLDSEPQPRL